MNKLTYSSFEQLITKRKKWVESTRENNFNVDRLLSEQNSNPSHFIYELLQNAEDAEASEVVFNLCGEYLEIAHNAKKDFDLQDVDGVTGIGNSTKTEDVNKIGKFGIGFKSVFAITKSPQIRSGQFHFQIDDFVVPVPLCREKIDGTKIFIPFNHPVREKDKIYALIEDKLQNIGSIVLLFLSNIKEIRWNTPSKKGCYCKTETSFKKMNDVKKVALTSQSDGGKSADNYLVFNQPVTIKGKSLKVEVAYRLETDESRKELIAPVQDSKLVVYFPTELDTNLKFIIQGPFKTTPNRENIQSDDQDNQAIIQKIAELIANSLPTIKQLGFLTSKFLQVLPTEKDHHKESIYSVIYEKVKDRFLSTENLLPTGSGDYAHPNDCLLARGGVLTTLLQPADLQLLFKKSHWLNANITHEQTPELKKYLISELGVDEIDFEYFAKHITKEFMESKSDDQVINFYAKLIDRDALFKEKKHPDESGVLRNKPIIRLNDDDHISPFSSMGKIQVYLPAEKKTQYKTVKKSIAEDKTALEFLKKLNIHKPDLFAEINEKILPNYKKADSEVQYLDDIEKILTAFSLTEDSDKKSNLIEALKKLQIIDAVNPTTGENSRCYPSLVYLNTNDLKSYFKGDDEAMFIHTDLYDKFGKEKFEAFAIACGCRNFPRRIEVDRDLSLEDKSKLRASVGWTSNISTTNYEYAGLVNILQCIDKKNSTTLWKMLVQSCLNYPGFSWRNRQFFQGEYRWMYYGERYASFPAEFTKRLQREKWLFNKTGDLVNPSEISISELDKDYQIDDAIAHSFEGALGFKPDEIKQIEKRTGGKFLSAAEFAEYEQLRKQKEKSKLESSDTQWNLPVAPDEAEISFSEVSPKPIHTPDLRNQSGGNGIVDTANKQVENKNRDTRIDSEHAKTIGEWGEKYVFRYLSKKRYCNLIGKKDTPFGFSGKDQSNNTVEVKWLNKNTDTGKGYDFVILENAVEIEYIEVKSTTEAGETLHQITGSQWEFARKLFNEGEGEKYKLCTVKNTGASNPEIKCIRNPVKLWKEGKLHAHPINLRL